MKGSVPREQRSPGTAPEQCVSPGDKTPTVPKMAAREGKKRTPKFSAAWLPKFGLRATTPEPDTSLEVSSLSCRFCEVFGRTGRADSDDGARKRKRTTRVMVFTPPWRTEHMQTHMVEQHGAHYARYSALSAADKDAFFSAPVLSASPVLPKVLPATSVAAGVPIAQAPGPEASSIQSVAPASGTEAAGTLNSAAVVAPPLPRAVTPSITDTPMAIAESSPPVQSTSVAMTPTGSGLGVLSAPTSVATALLASQQQQQQLHASVEAYYSSIQQKQKRAAGEAQRLVSEQIHAAGVPRGVAQLLEKLPRPVVDGFSSCGFPVPLGIRGLHVLVVGCGSGRDAYVASQLVGLAGSVTAVGHADDQLRLARELLGGYSAQLGVAYPNVRFVSAYSECLDLAGIPEQSVDVVIANGTLSASPFKEKVLEQAYRALRTGGELCLCDVFASRRLEDTARTHELLRGEWLGGALYTEDFTRLCRQTGFGEPRQLHAVPIDTSRSEAIAALVGKTRVYCATFRCFKVANMESGPREEDYGQVATYRGSIAEYPFEYTLDASHALEKGRAVRVGGNTAAILLESWLSRHFSVSGDRSVHFGPFDERLACGRRADRDAHAGGLSPSLGSPPPS